jgi:DNA-nicking Smr family endonuclease
VTKSNREKDNQTALEEASQETDMPEAVRIEIDGVLDTHSFSPRDLRTLIPDYLEECQRRAILSVRLIHGRGIGAVQRSVHALLARSPLVVGYRLADVDAGGRGATVVDLRPLSPTLAPSLVKSD